jgi:hypothetical protein
MAGVCLLPRFTSRRSQLSKLTLDAEKKTAMLPPNGEDRSGKNEAGVAFAFHIPEVWAWPYLLKTGGSTCSGLEGVLH